MCNQNKVVAKFRTLYVTLRRVTAGHRALPEIPLTTSTVPSSQQRRPGESRFQTWSSTLFDDDGHYADIYELDHYNYLEFDQPVISDAVEPRQRAQDGYEGLDPEVLPRLRRPPPPQPYAGIAPVQPRSRTDPDGYLEPVEHSENGNQSLEQLQQPSWPQDHHSSRSEETPVASASDQHQADPNRQGYEALDPSVVEELRRSERPHSYAGIDSRAANGRSDIHSYLEVIG